MQRHSIPEHTFAFQQPVTNALQFGCLVTEE